MDVHERHQLDAAARVQKVRARARPWRSILALMLAIAAAIAAEATRVNGLAGLQSASQTHRLIYICGLGAFFVLGMAAAIGMSARVRSTSKTHIGQAHAGVLRYSLTLVGVFAVVMFSLAIARIDVKELLVSGAVVGVVLGIAAQQSLANLFAGLVLLFAHPFRVGSRVGLRAGALGGQMNGLVVDIGLTYVRMETEEGPALLPNVQALAAVVLAIPQQPAAQTVTTNGSGTAGPAAGRVCAGYDRPGPAAR
jgi:small-conductance mechanosensitive channel